MSHAIEWCGFAGGWLLVAGPVYQAARELADEEFDRDAIAAASASLTPRRSVSVWWWLLPPVAYMLRRRRLEAQRRELLEVLDAQQLERLMHYRQTAVGWLYVAAGAFLIAIKETAELREALEWPHWVGWSLVIVMAGLSAANTVLRTRRRERILERAAAGP